MLRAWWFLMRSAIALGIVPFALAACSKKDAARDLGGETGGRAVEQAGDDEVSGDAVMKTKGGDVEMLTSDDWPAGMFVDVPMFRYGKVDRVASEMEGGRRKFNVWLRDVPEDASHRYIVDLTGSGWTAQHAAMGEQGEMTVARKGKLAVQFMHGVEDRSGVFTAFEVSD